MRDLQDAKALLEDAPVVRSEAIAARGCHTPQPDYSLAQLITHFLHLGTFGFGGPIALCGYAQRPLVEHRGWISPADYKEGLALALKRCRQPAT